MDDMYIKRFFKDNAVIKAANKGRKIRDKIARNAYYAYAVGTESYWDYTFD